MEFRSSHHSQFPMLSSPQKDALCPSEVTSHPLSPPPPAPCSPGQPLLLLSLCICPFWTVCANIILQCVVFCLTSCFQDSSRSSPKPGVLSFFLAEYYSTTCLTTLCSPIHRTVGVCGVAIVGLLCVVVLDVHVQVFVCTYVFISLGPT